MDGPRDLTIAELKERLKKYFSDGSLLAKVCSHSPDFERIAPTNAELRTSLNRWDRGIYPDWSPGDADTTFPIVEWKTSEKKPKSDAKVFALYHFVIDLVSVVEGPPSGRLEPVHQNRNIGLNPS
jgi:hypothetical protein